MLDMRPEVLMYVSPENIEKMLETIKANIDVASNEWAESRIPDKCNNLIYKAVASELVEQGWYAVIWALDKENCDSHGSVSIYLFPDKKVLELWRNSHNAGDYSYFHGVVSEV